MARLFISYKREDRSRVKELAERLREAGHTVWYDESIQIGDHWWDKICEEIEACDVFIFAISQVALRSVPCQHERSYATALGKTVLLIQVGKLTAVPTEFASVQYSDFSRGNSNALIGLIGAIHRAPPPPIPPNVQRPPAPIAPINEIAAILDTQLDLDFKDQSALLFRLKSLTADPQTRPESQRLIRQLLTKTQFVPIQTEARELLPKQSMPRGLLAFGIAVVLLILVGGIFFINSLNSSRPTQTLISTTVVTILSTNTIPPTTAPIETPSFTASNRPTLTNTTSVTIAFIPSTTSPTETEMSVDDIIATDNAVTSTIVAQSWTPPPTLTPTSSYTPTLSNRQKAGTLSVLTQTAQSWTKTPTVTKISTSTFTPTSTLTFTPTDSNGCKTSGELLVAIDANYPPFESIDTSSNQIVGFDIDLLSAIAEDQGFIINAQDAPFDTIFINLAAGQYDIVISAATITKERQKTVSFSAPYFVAGQVIIVRDRDKNKVSAPSDLIGKQIGVQLGTTGAEAAKGIKDARVNEYPTFPEVAQSLANGDVDAVISDNATALTYILNAPNLHLVVVGSSFTTENYGIAVRKDCGNLLTKINTGLVEVISSGKYAEIYRKYFGEDPTKEFLPGG